MKKRIIAVVLALTVLSALLAVNVSAENHFYEDFSESDAVNNGATWVRVSNQCPERFSLTAEDGTLRFRKNVTADDPAPSDQKRFENKLTYPGETSARVWMFDFCEAEDSTNVDLQGQWFFTPGLRIWYKIGRGELSFGSDPNRAKYTYTKGQWYSVMLMISEDYTNAEAYIKPQSGTEWTRFSTETTPSIVAGNVKNFNYVSLYENNYTNRYLDVRLDNIRFFNGGNLEGAGFTLDGKAVEAIEDIKGGELSVGAVFLREEPPTEKTAATTVFVAFDKDDMMIDFSFNPSLSIGGGANTLTDMLDTSEYYDRIGYVGYYLWDGELQPYFEAIELY